MEIIELSITVGELLGVPRVTLRGYLNGWHDQLIAGVLTGFRDQGTTSLVLDVSSLRFSGADGAAALVRVLRSIGPEMCIHVLTESTAMRILSKADLGPCIRLYSNSDEIAESLSPEEEFLTSRWLASAAGDECLPLAA
jgi:anti-anti-sigma regulatory factor